MVSRIAGLTVPAVLSALLVKSTAGFLTQPVRVAASSFTTGSAASAPRSSPIMSLWKIFGGAAQEMDYSQLKGMAATEAAGYALEGKVPAVSKDGYSIATFAGGCFWGIELAYQRVPGVVDTLVGYTQGKVDKPTYEAVCYADTGHTEGIQVFYDPKQVSFESLCELLFSRIDPTLKNQVGNDRGPQYRHGVYYHTEEQREKGEAVFEALQKKYSRPIMTELKPAAIFWPAEEYHQKYLSKGGRFGSPQSAAKGCSDPIRCYG